jgi:hypothetical protein
MGVQIITIRAEGISMDERQVLCDECAAVCASIAGVQATEWFVNPATETVCGMVRYSEHESIAMGAETLCREVAYLRAPEQVLACREIRCGQYVAPARPVGVRPTSRFVHFSPDYDPRG